MTKMAFSELAVLKSNSFQLSTHAFVHLRTVLMKCKILQINRVAHVSMQVYIVSGSNCVIYVIEYYSTTDRDGSLPPAITPKM